MSRLGYQLCAQPLRERAKEIAPSRERASDERRDVVWRLWLAGFLWLGIVAFGLALRGGYCANSMEGLRVSAPLVLLILATPVVLYCGYPIHRRAWRDPDNSGLSTESLLSLGALSAYLFSAVQVFCGATQVYFESACAIVTFALAAKLVEVHAKTKASRWVERLRQAAPDRVRWVADGHIRFVPTDSFESGREFLVDAGERFPADGRVESGSSRADESLLTGDAAPAAKQPGDAVMAGSMNLDAVLCVKATHTGDDTVLVQILARAERALRNRSPLEKWVEGVSRIIVPSVMAIALVTFGVCWLGSFADAGAALMRAVTVLVIACPWAFALATPLAVTAALGAASRCGVIMNDKRILETLGRVTRVVLDKTGTITEGRFELMGCEMAPDYCSSPAWMQANTVNSELDPLPADFPFDLFAPSYEQAFELLASLERYCEHPVAKALVNFARERGIPLGEASCVEVHKGLGVTGIVAGRSMFLGGRRLADNMAILIDARTELVARRWESEGRTVTFFGWDGGLKGCLAFGDTTRRNASSLVADLKRRGITPELVSGDSRATTEAIARQLGMENYHAEVLPEEKAMLIREGKANGAVIAMVGNGLDDAAALVEADLGIAMGDATDLASKQEVVLFDSDVRKIPRIFDLARKTMRVVRQNLFWAIFYNALGVALAVSGILNPTLAAAAMALSSLWVVGNSRRLGRADATFS